MTNKNRNIPSNEDREYCGYHLAKNTTNAWLWITYQNIAISGLSICLHIYE